jgi:glycosyltransferase involved in cell wall biosynthesis
VRLNPQWWRPKVFCLDKPGPLVDSLNKANVPCECLGVHRRNPIQAVVRLARGLRSFRPQLVQSFLFHANLATRLAAPWAGSAWVIGGLRVAERHKRWHLTLDRLTAPLSTGSVCVSQGVLQFSRDIARLDPARLTVIPNGIEIALFDAAIPTPRATLGIPDHVHLALYVGRLDRQKGLPDLLEAAEHVISKRPDWHLALAGDGPVRDWLLQQIANRTALSGKVHWLGRRRHRGPGRRWRNGLARAAARPRQARSRSPGGSRISRPAPALWSSRAPPRRAAILNSSNRLGL